MSTLVFVAQASGDDRVGYEAKLSDFPDTVIKSDNLPSLLRTARNSILEKLMLLETAGNDWPTPTSIETLQSKASAAGELLILIDVQVDDTPVRVNISIGERLLNRLDEAANAQDMSRSGFIAAAVRQRLGEASDFKTSSFETSNQQLRDELASVARRVNEAVGPDSSFGRAVAELDARALDGLRSLSSMLGKKPRGDSR